MPSESNKNQNDRIPALEDVLGLNTSRQTASDNNPEEDSDSETSKIAWSIFLAITMPISLPVYCIYLAVASFSKDNLSSSLSSRSSDNTDVNHTQKDAQKEKKPSFFSSLPSLFSRNPDLNDNQKDTQEEKKPSFFSKLPSPFSRNPDVNNNQNDAQKKKQTTFFSKLPSLFSRNPDVNDNQKDAQKVKKPSFFSSLFYSFSFAHEVEVESTRKNKAR